MPLDTARWKLRLVAQQLQTDPKTGFMIHAVRAIGAVRIACVYEQRVQIAIKALRTAPRTDFFSSVAK